ncbi:MAG: hypothetical protein IJ087_11030 [Eggerthellaceae bacterium]|nr:hypothetical protein [Eggerthellaceae bacterium]
MGIGEIYALVYANKARTVVASAFRRALGIPNPPTRGRVSVRRDRYRGTARAMRQRYGVRL